MTLTVYCWSCGRPWEIVGDPDLVYDDSEDQNDPRYDIPSGRHASCGHCGRVHRSGTAMRVVEEADNDHH